MELSTTQTKVISIAKRLQKFFKQETQTVNQRKTFDKNFKELSKLIYRSDTFGVSQDFLTIDAITITWEDFIKEVKQGLHLN